MERESINEDLSELEVYIYGEYHTDGLILVAILEKDECLKQLIKHKYERIENYIKDLGISVIYSESSNDRRIKEIANKYNIPLRFLDEGYEPIEKLKALSREIFFDEHYIEEYSRLLDEIDKKRKDEREYYWTNKIRGERGKVLVICGEAHAYSLSLKLKELGIKVSILKSAEELYDEGNLEIC